MKKKVAIVLALTMVVGSVLNYMGVAKASGIAAPTVRYNDAVMTGNGLSNVIDGNYESAYVSEDGPDMSEDKQYIQFEWAESVSYNKVTLFSKYCGTTTRDGQAPTKWKIQTSTDGVTYSDRSTVEATWEDNDDLQSKSVSFSTESYKYMRIIVSAANLNWNHYAINEIEFATLPGVVITSLAVI